MPFVVQGWLGSGLLSWPLFCSPSPATPGACLSSGDALPYFLIHGALFYGSVIVITCLKRFNMWPAHTGVDKAFDNTLHVAWHIPLTFTSIPMSALALASAYGLWVSGDPERMYGGVLDPVSNEAATWFACFYIIDCFIIVAHRLCTKEMFVLHCIFGVVLFILTSRVQYPLIGMVLIAQEMSTPALNVFSLLRAFKGLQCVWTQLSFLVFALLFFAFRVFMNLYGTSLFLPEIASNMNGPTLNSLEQAMLAIAVAGGALLQLYWAQMIAKKIYQALFSTKTRDDRRQAENGLHEALVCGDDV
eukprot:TRINITY_DN3704_c0_g5_i1.p1 TRINITY_DN3704_c0_g5~~TRINITY_DN3704_c0_g5_i1.p1  ORF type:complete len:303 (+),score=23.67 TRINITY_DN3704_c0_g5_i1:49-957(+)